MTKIDEEACGACCICIILFRSQKGEVIQQETFNYYVKVVIEKKATTLNKI